MNLIFRHIRIFLIIILAFFCICLPQATAAEHTVAPSGAEFTSIQEAINRASPGDTVTVESGTYGEKILLDKKITLRGIDNGGGVPVIDSLNKGNAVEILMDGCTVEGFTIQNSELMSGIRVESNANTIRKNILLNNAQGILLVSARKNLVTGNNITKSGRYGIVLEGSTDNRIEDNSVIKNTVGIALDESSLSNGIFRNNFYNTQNVISKSATSLWSSTDALTYMYLGQNEQGRMGNYWSDYRGRDKNRDGIGDSPYVIKLDGNSDAILESSRNIYDNYPLMDPKEYYTGIWPAPVVTRIAPEQTPAPTDSPGNSLPVSTIAIVIIGVVIAGVTGAFLVVRRKGGGGVFRIPPLTTRVAALLKTVVADRARSPSPVTTPAPQTSHPDTYSTGQYTSAAEQKNYFPKELENKYTDITYVGRGGIAWVFSAHRKTDNCKVAVKIPISFDEMTGKCFLNEIAAWERLRHENIVEVTAVNILPVPYVEMEFVPCSLEAIEKPLPVWKAVHIIRGIADGLRYAHEHGFIHRDIKPHNILLTEDMVPKITDWGMSKVLAADVQKSSIAGFSLSYAAPEQVSPSEFGRTGEQTDIYQLGVVFYELVTGSIPFGGESIVEVGNAILRENATPPSEYNPDAAAVEKIIHKCLEKDPAQRYQSAAELLDALSRYLDEDDA